MREKRDQPKGILRESSAVALVPALLAPVLGLLIICLVVASCSSTTSPPTPTTKYTLTVTVSPAGMGAVTQSPNQTQYTAGTVVTLTATPVSGYVFTGWSEDATGSTNPTSVTMNANKSVTGNFGQLDLVVASLTHSPANPTTADTMTFVVTVQNIGNATAGASVMSLRVGWEANPLWYSVPPLAPNATYQVTYTHQVVYAQCYLNTATADATNVVTESNESNNEATDLFTVTAADTTTSVTRPPASL